MRNVLGCSFTVFAIVVVICSIAVAMADAFDNLGIKHLPLRDRDCYVDQHFDLDMTAINMTITDGASVRVSYGGAFRRNASPCRVKALKRLLINIPANPAASRRKSEIILGQKNMEKSREAHNEARATLELKTCDADDSVNLLPGFCFSDFAATWILMQDTFLHLAEIRTPLNRPLIMMKSGTNGHLRLSLGVETGNVCSKDDSQIITGTSRPHEFPSALVPDIFATFVLFYDKIVTLVQSFAMVGLMMMVGLIIFVGCRTFKLLLHSVVKLYYRERNDQIILRKSITNCWRGLFVILNVSMKAPHQISPMLHFPSMTLQT